MLCQYQLPAAILQILNDLPGVDLCISFWYWPFIQFYKERICFYGTNVINYKARRCVPRYYRRGCETAQKNDLKIIAMKMIWMTKKQAQGFYAVHKERPFFDSLTDFMSSGPAVIMILEGENAISRYRDIMGATDYRKAENGTIRKDFATDIEKNVVHGSDSPKSATFEMGYFFNQFEIAV